MERIADIKKEITEKNGKEWVGLQSVTENQLESLLYFLEHPKLLENSKLVDELTDLYYRAKVSNFTKMEGIIRKLDQLSITLGKYDTPEASEVKGKYMFTNYPKAILELKNKIELMLHSPLGTSLPEKTQKSIIAFFNYLNHPDVPNRPDLFDEMYHKFEFAKASDFLKMQTLDDLLNKLEIKLGEITADMKAFKTIEEQKEELDTTKKELAEELDKLKKEKEELAKEKEQLKAEIEDLKKEREQLEIEKNKIEKDKERLLKEWEEFNEGIKKLEEKLKKS